VKALTNKAAASMRASFLLLFFRKDIDKAPLSVIYQGNPPPNFSTFAGEMQEIAHMQNGPHDPEKIRVKLLYYLLIPLYILL
jgi:hypothetical protein